MGIIKIIKSRRSVREYTDESIPKNDLEYIIEAAGYAPSNGSVQPWFFIVVTDEYQKKQLKEKVDNALAEDVKKIIEDTSSSNSNSDNLTSDNLTKIAERFKWYSSLPEAPAYIFMFEDSNYTHLFYDNFFKKSTNPCFLKAWNDGIHISIAMAVQNMLLAAADLGYGTCLRLGPMIYDKKIIDYFNLDTNRYKLHSALSIGKPKGATKPLKRKPLNEIYSDGLSLMYGINFQELEHFVKDKAGEKILEHSKRSVYYALILNETLRGNPLIVRLGALLHDVGYEKDNPNTLEQHAENGVEIIQTSLPCKLEDNILKEVIYCVKYHAPSLRTDNPTKEFKAVHDGEKIDFLLNHQDSSLYPTVYDSLYLQDAKKMLETLKTSQNK